MTWLPGHNKRTALADGLFAHLGPAPDKLEALWCALEMRADASAFQSWLWNGCCQAARFTNPLLLTIDDGARIVAAGLLGRRTRLGIDRWHVGTTGDSGWDSVFIEHNGPLVERDRPEAQEAWYVALARYAARSGIGVMIDLPGIGDSELAAARRAGLVGVAVSRQAPWCDLAELRASKADCLDQVSANTRQQVRRAFRRYEMDGPVVVRRATGIWQAEEDLAALALLHQATWQARSLPGAFAPPQFRAFHAAMVKRGVSTGFVDMLRITAGPRVIGYLYNIVYRSRVHAYQSGFDYAVRHTHEKPGLVCHVAAMRHYQADGLAAYDFLAGAERYKTSLADRTATLHWVRAAPRWSVAGQVVGARDTVARLVRRWRAI